MTISRFSATTIRERARQLRTVPFVLPGTMSEAMDWLAERSEEVHPNSLVKIAGALKGFAKGWSEMNDEPNPLARLPWPKGTQAPPGRIADEAVIEKLIRSLQAKTSFVRGTKLEQARALRDLLIVRLLFSTGGRQRLALRRGPFCVAPPSDLARCTINMSNRYTIY
jgi:site-specific recombinase XerD